jgi:hypothetical protein
MNRKRTTINDYLNEPIIIGGEETTRGRFIKEMQDNGIPQRVIDMYLIGFDYQKALHEESRP